MGRTMDRPVLYITRRLRQPVLDAIPKHYRIFTEPTDQPPTADARRRGFAEADAVICTLSDPVDAALLSQATRLKVLANYAVGYNNIDIPAATRHGIIVTNTPDVLTDATADLTWALLLSVARRVVEGDRWLRSGGWPGWSPTQLLGADVSGKTLGIIGMGRIGQAVAMRAVGFRMSVVYSSRRAVSSPPGFTWIHQPLERVLAQSDFLSLHVPLTDTTHHLIGPRQLSAMKPTAFLINTSRGPVIDESALITALETKSIGGAALDVYAQEPQVPSALTSRSDVVLLPHLGSATLESRVRMGLICLTNIAAVLEGRPAPNPVNADMRKE